MCKIELDVHTRSNLDVLRSNCTRWNFDVRDRTSI